MRWLLDTSPIPRTQPPDLDPDQRAVVAHRRGALLVLAGPGTGKTTTLVEAVVERLAAEPDRLTADDVLVLTFGRRAAEEIRDRIAGRIGGGSLPTVATFHSFAYGYVNLGLGANITPPRLLSGAEEDVRIRDLLLGAVQDGTIDWPDDLTDALPTLGLANEVRAVLARARTLRIEPTQLQRIGRRADRPAWRAVGQLAVQDEEVMALQDVMDYTDLLVRALVRAQAERPQYRLIVVDEYQDTDPLQVALLQALTGPSTTLIAVGDPDQAIYGFRGADVRAISRFATDFPNAAPPIVLQQVRRFGPRIKKSANAILSQRAIPGIPADVQRAHRAVTCVGAGADDVSVTLHDSLASMAADVAEQVARAHLEREVPWDELAVLTRTGRDMAEIERALLAAHIPVAMSVDDMPLRLEPAVGLLLGALRIAMEPKSMRPADAVELLTGPLGGLSVDQVRQWGRSLRTAARADDQFPPPADTLMRAALIDDAPIVGGAVVTETEQRAEGLRVLLRTAHDHVRKHGTPAEVLWTLWSGRVDGRHTHGWPERLRSAALRGSRTANHDLDAVMALFDSADRFAGRKRGAAGVRDFLDSLAAQELPAEPVAERGLRADAVRVLTAHRAKGLEWDEVWVVGAQEGVWPDVRPRGSVLEPARLDRDGLGEGPNVIDLLDEERRLFYVALTRARFRVHVAVIDEEGESRPSRFVDELRAAGAKVSTTPAGQPVSATSLPSLVAELRGALGDPNDGAAAAALLAQLAAARDDDAVPLVPAADPAQWWGIAEPTRNERPLVAPDAAVRLSGSVVESVNTCPRRWFLERKAHAQEGSRNAAATGSIVHGVAEYVAREKVPADLEAMNAIVDDVWRALRFEAPWQSLQQRERARNALAGFLEYHLTTPRTLESLEDKFEAVIEVPTPDGGTEQVAISGTIDRLERDADDRFVPVDLKTSKTRVSKDDTQHHAQLGLYQLLIQQQDDEAGGAVLLQLGLNTQTPTVTSQDPLPADGPTWVDVALGSAAAVVRSEDLQAKAGEGCVHCDFRASCPTQAEGQVFP